MDKQYTNTLLIIDDEDNMLHMLSAVMRKEGYDVVTASNGQQGLDYALGKSFDFILCDLKMPQMDGLAFLEQAKKHKIDATIIMMSAFATVDTAVKAMQDGAYDFITKPFRTDEILGVLDKALELDKLKKENTYLRSRVAEIDGESGFDGIISISKEMANLIDTAKRVASYDTTVLITGESGTGKELLAKGIYNHSKRSEGPFVCVNCGSIPLNLLESEFFGYLKGAFTGANEDHIGIFETANGGTLFLDEIGELPLALQVKLLRVLQEREIRPVGSSSIRSIDVRVIAATAKNLSEEVLKKTFRQDLFFRLNVIELQLPPLRARRVDIPPLAQHFLEKKCVKFDRSIERIENNVIALLLGYSWPGNVRELENIIERAVVYSDGNKLQGAHFPDHLNGKIEIGDIANIDQIYSMKEGKKIIEKYMINRALEKTEGNKSKAAKLLEVSYPSLLSKIKTLEIKIEN